ncbi:hypothetical protein S40293_11622 [Stachybotrys chartarum IBT 40293]|nr:hypothetical protein S40293_11622 [Stachybotrys chartarum IBT 40293]
MWEKIAQSARRVGNLDLNTCCWLDTVLDTQAATGTCRTNCGLYKPFVVAKKEDRKGRCWAYNRVEAIPTPDCQLIIASSLQGQPSSLER